MSFLFALTKVRVEGGEGGESKGEKEGGGRGKSGAKGIYHKNRASQSKLANKNRALRTKTGTGELTRKAKGGQPGPTPKQSPRKEKNTHPSHRPVLPPDWTMEEGRQQMG